MRSAARISAFLGVCLLSSTASPAAAQGILDRAAAAAARTGIGKAVRNLSAEADLIDATKVDLDGRGLPTVQVGPLTFGVSAVEIKEGEAVRLHTYLLNPGTEPASVPLPSPEFFVLIDEHGRRLERLGGVAVKDAPKGAAEITVPALERVTLYILFGDLKASPGMGTLKIAESMMIPGIPLSAVAAGSLPPAGSSGGSSNPWVQPPSR